VSSYLCDTHVALWAAGEPGRLRPATLEILADTSVRVAVSAVSIAEMVIKVGIGKLQLPVSPVDLCQRLGLAQLDLTWDHASLVSSLPPIHNDPFDRLLIAQAQVEGLVLITSDRLISLDP
jgi:PIN domain nuclease of toxin-antitoxin system